MIVADRLKYREELLYSLAEKVHYHADKPMYSLKVTFLDQAGNFLAEFYGFSTALNVIVQDLCCNEEWDWSEAFNVRLELY